MKAIKHDEGDGSSLAGDCSSAATAEKDGQTSKLYLSCRKGNLSYCSQGPQAVVVGSRGLSQPDSSMGYIHSHGT